MNQYVPYLGFVFSAIILAGAVTILVKALREDRCPKSN